MLKLQEYLRQGNSLNSLRGAPYHLIIKEEGELAILKYNQAESDFSEPIVQEARGIIFFKPTWDVVCAPFFKFFNATEKYAAKLDESELYVYQKIDGSLAKVWFFEGHWHLSSNNRIDASEASFSSGSNFQALFMRCLSHYGLDWESFTSTLDEDYTYMYEMATPDNRVVVQYDDYYLFYLGQRNIHTFQEEYHPDKRIDNVKIYNFKTVDEVVFAAKKLPNSEEGYVVRDKNWNRVKIKNPVYLILHHIANNGKPNFLQYVLEHNEEELLAYFPNYKVDLDQMKKRLCSMGKKAEYFASLMEPYYNLNRAEFAKCVFKGAIPPYYQTFVFKTYENHLLTWAEYTKDWDTYAWERILARSEGDFRAI